MRSRTMLQDIPQGPQGLNRLQKNSEQEAKVAKLAQQGLKPASHFATLTARLKPCPCYKAATDGERGLLTAQVRRRRN